MTERIDKTPHPMEGFHDGIFLGFRTLEDYPATVVLFVLDTDGHQFELQISDLISFSANIVEMKSSIYEIQISESEKHCTLKFLSNMESELTAEFTGEVQCFKINQSLQKPSG